MAHLIGGILEQARIRTGQTVPDVSHATRISETVIRALEADDFTVFPDARYVRRFVVLYAEHLGLDLDQIEAAAALAEGKPTRSIPRSLELPVRAERIPIVKGVQIPVRRNAKSILAPLAALVILLLLPSAFLLGKRVGENRAIREAREVRRDPDGSPPVADGSGNPAPLASGPSGG